MSTLEWDGQPVEEPTLWEGITWCAKCERAAVPGEEYCVTHIPTGIEDMSREEALAILLSAWP